MHANEEPHPNTQQEWLPPFPEGSRPLGRRQAELWALVLDARSIPCRIEVTSGAYRLLVPEVNRESARAELLLYEEQNRDWPPPLPPARSLMHNILPTLSVLLLLATFHNLTLLGISLPGRGVLDPYELGTAHAAAIRDGQWWRLVTSLTLHADSAHLLGNLTIGGGVIILLCRELGSGLAWSLLLAAGTLGNLANAWLQAPGHRSLGASTAVFAAVGVFSAMAMLRRRRQPLRMLVVPLGAGLALLALLGSEGKQTDLGAHLLGFGFGLLLGLATELMLRGQRRPSRLTDAALALAAAALVATAWWAALTWG